LRSTFDRKLWDRAKGTIGTAVLDTEWGIELRRSTSWTLAGIQTIRLTAGYSLRLLYVGPRMNPISQRLPWRTDKALDVAYASDCGLAQSGQ
jgi:hypothetical protein